ncbi:MAG: type II secretion system protein [Phycisphaerales bacterium JB059]
MSSTGRRRAFTMIEMVVVVVVIGILAAMVAPRFVMARNESAAASTVEDLRNIETAIGMYKAQTGAWPKDVSRTQVVKELNPYFRGGVNPFAKDCPIGGVYDYEGPPAWNPPHISIRKSGSKVYTEADALLVDKHFDDGNLSTGIFRKSGSSRLTYSLD